MARALSIPRLKAEIARWTCVRTFNTPERLQAPKRPKSLGLKRKPHGSRFDLWWKSCQNAHDARAANHLLAGRVKWTCDDSQAARTAEAACSGVLCD
jgi:hypothetical protein